MLHNNEWTEQKCFVIDRNEEWQCVVAVSIQPPTPPRTRRTCIRKYVVRWLQSPEAFLSGVLMTVLRPQMTTHILVERCGLSKTVPSADNLPVVGEVEIMSAWFSGGVEFALETVATKLTFTAETGSWESNKFNNDRPWLTNSAVSSSTCCRPPCSPGMSVFYLQPLRHSRSAKKDVTLQKFTTLCYCAAAAVVCNDLPPVLRSDSISWGQLSAWLEPVSSMRCFDKLYRSIKLSATTTLGQNFTLSRAVSFYNAASLVRYRNLLLVIAADFWKHMHDDKRVNELLVASFSLSGKET